MNLREPEYPVRPERPARVRQPVGSTPALWLACYPIFQEALQYGETTFRALPQHAKLVALKRVSAEVAEHGIAPKILDEVRASFVELHTGSLDEAAQSYLSKHAERGDLCADHHSVSLEELVAQIPATNYPLMARPPCVLRPGEGIFLDGWMRFFSYRARGDRTIPLLAIDWPVFHERLASAYC
jgi:hypothetical protein